MSAGGIPWHARWLVALFHDAGAASYLELADSFDVTVEQVKNAIKWHRKRGRYVER